MITRFAPVRAAVPVEGGQEWMTLEDWERRAYAVIEAQAVLLDDMRIELVRARAERDILEHVLHTALQTVTPAPAPVAGPVPVVAPTVPLDPSGVTWAMPAEIAALRGCALPTVYGWVQNQKVRTRRTGRNLLICVEDTPPPRKSYKPRKESVESPNGATEV